MGVRNFCLFCAGVTLMIFLVGASNAFSGEPLQIIEELQWGLERAKNQAEMRAGYIKEVHKGSYRNPGV